MLLIFSDLHILNQIPLLALKHIMANGTLCLYKYLREVMATQEYVWISGPGCMALENNHVMNGEKQWSISPYAALGVKLSTCL